jgi:hypothetical protein
MSRNYRYKCDKKTIVCSDERESRLESRENGERGSLRQPRKRAASLVRRGSCSAPSLPYQRTHDAVH